VVSLDACSNAFAALTPILDNSFVLSRVCCTVVLNASIFANIVLFTSLVAANVLSAKHTISNQVNGSLIAGAEQPKEEFHLCIHSLK
jgi:hypothetical protein